MTNKTTHTIKWQHRVRTTEPASPCRWIWQFNQRWGTNTAELLTGVTVGK